MCSHDARKSAGRPKRQTVDLFQKREQNAFLHNLVRILVCKCDYLMATKFDNYLA